MKRVLMVDRGVIALRAARACRTLDLESVAACSVADGNSPQAPAPSRVELELVA